MPFIVGRTPLGFQPQPGSPGGGGIPFGNGPTGSEARDLFRSLNLQGGGQLPVAVFPPFADGQIFSPRTGLRSTAVIFTESNSRKRRGLREFRDNFVNGIGTLFERFKR